jgi:hypothetical protein
MSQSTPSNPRDERIAREAADLWRELYGEAPPTAEGGSMLDMICARLPAEDYDRLRSPYLRSGDIAYPRRRAKTS